MTTEARYSSLNNHDENATEYASESTHTYSIEDILEIKNDLGKKNKKSKMKKYKKVRKEIKKTRKELSIVKNEISSVKQALYEGKLNQLVACNDPAERKKIAAELKRGFNL